MGIGITEMELFFVVGGVIANVCMKLSKLGRNGMKPISCVCYTDKNTSKYFSIM